MTDSRTPSPELCILAGAPRSGTTWIQRLLQAHDDICGGEESHFFEGFSPALRMADIQARDSRSIGPLTYVSRDAYEDLFRGVWQGLFADLFASAPAARIHLEKTPSNCLYLDEITRLFPEAKIIFICRDARAVTSSVVHASASWGKNWAPSTWKGAAILWQRHCAAVLRWRQQNPDHPFLMLKYEDAIADTEGTLQRILDFLMPGEEHRTGEILEAWRAGQSDQKEPQGFARVRGTDGWKKDMTLRGKLITWRYTRRTMRELGYDISPFS